MTYKEYVNFPKKKKNICLYDTGRVAVSVRAISSDVGWCRFLHEVYMC